MVAASAALANPAAGVSDERVSLPRAPGSIDGVGQNATLEGNQGALRYGVTIDVPQGFPGVTPELTLGYSSSSGSGVLGLGWSMPSFSIERMVLRGLQRYDVDDLFGADGSEELVRVSVSGDTAVYRQRFEGAFIRWTWRNRGAGEGGYWTAEYPDGRVGTFGATPSGSEVTTAQVRVPGTSRVWRWHLTELTDPFGHRMVLTWTKDGTGHPVLERIDYGYEGTTPRHSVRFTYESRGDVISNATPGFELRLTQRLRDVRVVSGTEVMRAYVIAYEPEATAGGASRIASISRFGRGNVAYPVTFRFGYSRTLGGTCTGAECTRPFVGDMGTLSGVDFSTGRATLIDMNGDALPDVVFSDAQGRHSIFTARLDGEGRTSFSPSPRTSSRTTGSSPFILGDPRVQVIDVNGDGFVDITQAKLPAVLCNDGSGDWVGPEVCTGSAVPGLPGSFTPEDDGAEPSQADPRNVRFFDYDNDRRIDWLRTPSGGSTTEVLANTPAGFEPVTVMTIGAVFDESPLQLADMNGDGLQDPVQLVPSGPVVQVQYRLNLGFGNWAADWSTITLSGLDASQASVAELQDVNGDGLADVVAVSGNEVRLALNRNGARFDQVMVLTGAELAPGSSMPVRTGTTVMAYADMNGNGSDDIVWIQTDGRVQYLELFPVRPNLIARIENAVGAVQLVTYGSSITEQARDTAAGRPWTDRVPNAYTVVKQLDSFVTLTGSDSGGLKEVTRFDYHSGFYDGVEKRFRGYEQVERRLLANPATDGREPGVVVEDYDVGVTDPVLAGFRVRTRVLAGAAGEATLSESASLVAVCPVADVGTPARPISFACERARTTTLIERDPSSAVTTRTEYEYDGYGNRTVERMLGVVHLGTPQSPRPCDVCSQSGAFGAPCGMMCTGDERITTREYITPGTATGGAWFVGKARRQTVSGVEGMPVAETRLFYDGPDFEGLDTGLTKGLVRRQVDRTGPGATEVITTRYRHDVHGNEVERIEPNGSVAVTDNHRVVGGFDPSGLNRLFTELKVGGGKTLRRDYVWDVAWEQLAQSSSWYPVVAGAPAGSILQTRYRYDEHQRLVRVLEQGDTDADPAEEIAYSLGDPASRITVQKRSSPQGDKDVVEARCLDGRGRVFQVRNRIDATRWQVSGFTEFDARGMVVRRFQPYVSTSAGCDVAPPPSVPFTRFTFDAAGRPLSEVEPDGSVRRLEYRPLVIRRLDENDTDPSSPFAGTPVVEEFDGLDRLVAFQRSLTSSGPQPRTTITYDALGRIATVRDPAGSLKTQTHDALGRVLTVADPNAGTTRYEYDANGNVVRMVDARNVAVRMTYDGADRLLTQHDEANQAGTIITSTYDAVAGCTECTAAGGELVEQTYPGGTDRLGYDARGRQVYQERIVDGVSLITRQRFDGADRLVSVTYPSGLTLDRTYDGMGRVTGIPSYLDAVEYDERGQPARIRSANGVLSESSYDNRLRLAGLTITAGAAKLLDLTYTRDRASNLTAVVERTVPSGPVRHALTATYDGWERPVTVSLPRTGADPEVLTFGFDVDDNITSITSTVSGSPAGVGTFTYDAARPNAVTQAGTMSLGYDARGNVTSRGDRTYTRDAFNRLVAVSREGQTLATFTPGVGPDRVKRQEGPFTTVYVTPELELRDGIGTLYVKLGQQRVARAQTVATARLVLSDLAPATGTGAVRTVQGDGIIDVADAWLAQAARAGVVQLSGGPTPSPVPGLLASAARRLLAEDVVWLHTDHQQSVVAATGVTGAVVAEQSFYPTGLLRSSTGFVDAYGFAGGEHVASTGLIAFEERDLDPRTGRWTQVDPQFLLSRPESIVEYGESTGGYGYVANNFLTFIDPSGLAKESAAKGKDKASSNTRSNSAKGGKDAKVSPKKNTFRKFFARKLLGNLLSLIGSAFSIAAATQDGDTKLALGITGTSLGALGNIAKTAGEIQSFREDRAKEIADLKKANPKEQETPTRKRADAVFFDSPPTVNTAPRPAEQSTPKKDSLTTTPPQTSRNQTP